MSDLKARLSLNTDDIDQIIEGIDHFCIGPGEDEDGELTRIWQPYIDKLKTLRAALLVGEEPQVSQVACRELDEKAAVGEEPAADHPEPLKGNWHAIEGPNGMCGCGPDEGCPERLARHIRQQIDFWQAKAKFLERERDRTLDELPDAWQRVPGSLALKVRAFREFAEPYISASTQSKGEEPAADPWHPPQFWCVECERPLWSVEETHGHTREGHGVVGWPSPKAMSRAYPAPPGAASPPHANDEELRFHLRNRIRDIEDLKRGALEAVNSWTPNTPDSYAQRSELEKLQYQLWVAVKQQVEKALEVAASPRVHHGEREEK